MRLKIFLTFILTLFCTIGLTNFASADFLMPPDPVGKTKGFPNCVKFELADKVADEFLVVVELQLKESDGHLPEHLHNIRYKPLNSDKCYTTHPTPSVAIGWVSIPAGEYIQNFYAVEKKDLTNELKASINNHDYDQFNNEYQAVYKKSYDDEGNRPAIYYLNNYPTHHNTSTVFLNNNGFFYHSGALSMLQGANHWIIKESAPIENIEFDYYINEIVLEDYEDQDRLDKKYISKIDRDLRATVTEEGQDKQIFNESKFLFYIEQFKPEFLRSQKPNLNSYYFPPTLALIAGLIITLILELIIFFLFKLRKFRNYIYLIIANVVSYSIAILIQSTFFIISNYTTWLIIEGIVILLEFAILAFAFRKIYSKKKIFLIVFIANFITAALAFIVNLFEHIL